MSDSDDEREVEMELEEEEPVHILTGEDWKNKGNDFYKAKSYREAVKAYSMAIELEPTNGSYFTNRAAASLMLLQYKETVQDCDSAIALDNTNSKAYFRKVTALKGLGRLQDAINSLNAGLVHDPKSVTAIKDLEALNAAKTELADLSQLVQSKQFRVALPRIDKLISSLGNNFRDLNLMRVECLLELKRPEDAYNLTNSLMKTAQNGDVDLLRLRAQCFYVMGDIENALKHLQQAVRSDPDNTTVRAFYRKIKEIDDKKQSGDEQFKKGSWQAAIDQWTQCIELTRDNRPYASKLYLNRATAQSKLKDYKNAVKDCNVAVGFNPAYIKAYLRRVDCLMAMGGPENIEAAIADYEKLMEIDNEEDKSREYQAKIKKAKVALKRSKRKDLYAILGVDQTATEAEIKSAYRKSALKFHPDKQSSKSDAEKAEAEASFKAVNEAYEILSNPETKEKYDNGVEVEDMENPHAGHGHGHGHHGMDPNMMFQMFMQQQQMGGGRGGRGGGGFGGFGGF